MLLALGIAIAFTLVGAVTQALLREGWRRLAVMGAFGGLFVATVWIVSSRQSAQASRRFLIGTLLAVLMLSLANQLRKDRNVFRQVLGFRDRHADRSRYRPVTGRADDEDARARRSARVAAGPGGDDRSGR